MHSQGRIVLPTLVGFALSSLLFGGCGADSDLGVPTASIEPGSDSTNASSDGGVGPVELTAQEPSTESPAEPPVNLHPEVLMRTSMGDIRIRLNADKAPQTVENFLQNYVERGFYNRTIFHFVESGYMIAGGGFSTEREAKETRMSVRNESHHGLSNRRGTIAMARNPDFADSATSQFFINLADNSQLDHQPNEDEVANGYCVFGEIIEGMEVVDQIAAVEVEDIKPFEKTPVTPIVIESVERLD